MALECQTKSVNLYLERLCLKESKNFSLGNNDISSIFEDNSGSCDSNDDENNKENKFKETFSELFNNLMNHENEENISVDNQNKEKNKDEDKKEYNVEEMNIDDEITLENIDKFVTKWKNDANYNDKLFSIFNKNDLDETALKLGLPIVHNDYLNPDENVFNIINVLPQIVIHNDVYISDDKAPPSLNDEDVAVSLLHLSKPLEDDNVSSSSTSSVSTSVLNKRKYNIDEKNKEVLLPKKKLRKLDNINNNNNDEHSTTNKLRKLDDTNNKNKTSDDKSRITINDDEEDEDEEEMVICED
eukprot:TRINITY_DN372_c3_g1_i1.p1 TRINITY_DN372_c3_g1~~TRINITY_DN372_c3_g1_i1.p1  ORF type:complete len:300 (+),score=88.58 TRINITY_DN372_c3_g1_i1:46-945(+)